MSPDAGYNAASFLSPLEKTIKNDTNTKQLCIADAFHDCLGVMERVSGDCYISLERSTQLKRK